MIEIVGLIAIGFIAGSLAASLGLGGGVVFVPALVILVSFDQHLAQGTSLAVILPTAIVSTIGHTRAGRVKWPVAIPLASAGIAGGLLGAWLALSLGGDMLRRLFVLLLAILAIRMALRTRRLFLDHRTARV